MKEVGWGGLHLPKKVFHWNYELNEALICDIEHLSKLQVYSYVCSMTFDDVPATTSIFKP